VSVCPTSAEGARIARGSGDMRPREILKVESLKCHFLRFGGDILSVERVRNEDNINETRPSLMTILINIINV
jgi:hypothetical protein